MQIGPIRFFQNGNPSIELIRAGHPVQDITIPAVVVTVVAVFTLCCCLRVVF